MQHAQTATLRSFWLGNAILVAVLLAAMIGGHFTASVGAFAFSALATFCYTLLFLLPGLLLTRLASLLSFRLAASLGVVYAALLMFALHIDARLFAMYGFHFNGFVWNLLTTPGGFASLGSSSGSNLGLAVQVLVVVGGEILWLALCRFAADRQLAPPKSTWKRTLLVWVPLLAVCQLTFGFTRIYDWHPAADTAREIPFFMNTRVYGLADTLGIKVVRQKSYSAKGRLNYPRSPIVSGNHPWSPNFIWLVTESLRADMLTPEIMPNLWQFSQDAHRFTNHYSGGNGTRMGLFSMFYSLPGNYWFDFLSSQRDPAFIRLLQKRGYLFQLRTSANFTYPEFNMTIFARFPASELHQHESEPTFWQNDIYNTGKYLEFLDQARQQPKPWFAFLFFNATHARYQFPDSSVIRPDYLKDFNYAREDVDDFKRNIVQIKNRDINAAHFVDTQIGRIIDYVNAHDLKKDTIIVITGDHGEEFMERGRWGHNSEIHNAQIHTPLVLWIPGKGKGVHDYPTSHLDFMATFMPLMGVTTPLADYSVGRSLLDPDTGRYRLAANWDQMAVITSQYKEILPVRDSNLSGVEYFTADDNPVSDKAAANQALQGALIHALDDMSRFYRKGG